MKLAKSIGSMIVLVLLFVCSTTFANEYNEIASKLMQTQNCSFNINSYNLSYDNAEALCKQQLETIRKVQQIFKDCAVELIRECPNFETLLLTLRSGIRFGGGFYTPDEDIQLGTGPANYRKSIHTTGDVLARFGQALNKIVEKFQTASNAPEWNQIVIDSVDLLTRKFRVDLPIAFIVMDAFMPNVLQSRNTTFQDTVQQLGRLADGLIGLANQWESQLVLQKENCERYMQDTFDSPVEKIVPFMDPLAVELEAFDRENSLILYFDALIHSNQSVGAHFANPIGAFVKLTKSTEKLDQYAKMLKYLSSATLDMLRYLKSSPVESSPALEIYDQDTFVNYVKEVKSTLNAILKKHLGENDKQLANIIAKMSQSTQFNRTSDVLVLLLVAKVLERMIHSKFVLQQYDGVVEALKQHVFPYAHLHLKDVGFNRNSTDIEYLVASAVNSLERIENEFSITYFGGYTFTQPFDSESFPCAIAPFYVWSNASVYAVDKLLSGQSATLKADIRLSNPRMDAIKFGDFLFNIKAKNASLQPELDTILKYFAISASHMGDSYYRYGGKYYVIKHEQLNIWYSFRKESDGTPSERNGPFITMQKGSTFTASPYAVWHIQLVESNDIKTISFDWLVKYKGQVYLELIGRGQFVKSRAAVDHEVPLKKYYTEYCPNDDISAERTDQNERLEVMKQKCSEY